MSIPSHLLEERAELRMMRLTYESEDWYYVLPSFAFVVVYVGSRRGFGRLRISVNKGYDDTIKVAEIATSVVAHLNEDLIKAQRFVQNYQTFVAKIRSPTTLSLEAGVSTESDLESKRRILDQSDILLSTANAALGKIRYQRAVFVDCHIACDLLLRRFDVLRKISKTLDEIHEEYGRSYARHPVAIKKLVICMKCLDQAWGSMRHAYRVFKLAEERALSRDYYKFPYEKFENIEGFEF